MPAVRLLILLTLSTLDASADVPSDLAAAPGWIGRTYSMTMVAPGKDERAGDRHVTYTLQRAGGRAALSVVKLAGTLMGGPEKLHETSRVTYLGTATEKAGVVTIAVENGEDKLAFTCKRTKLRAARADAGLEYRDPHLHDLLAYCGDSTTWKPAGTKPLVALLCTTDQKLQLAFAPAPGIEWVYISDSCFLGSGWRAVPADGAVREPRAPGSNGAAGAPAP